MSSSTGDALSTMYHALFAHYGPQGWWPAKTREEVIIGAILTQNTAWRNVERALDHLRQADRLRFDRLADLNPDALAELIRPAGTYNIKAKRLKAFTAWLDQRFHGDLDAMFATEMHTLRRELLTVSGIGRETCDAILLYAGRMPSFVVDAYTHRILRRHFLIDSDVDYEEMKALFEDHLDHDHGLYNEYHALLVAVGKDYCRPQARCRGCPLEPFEHDAHN